MTKQGKKSTLVKGNLDPNSLEKLNNLITMLRIKDQATKEKAEQKILDLMPPGERAMGFFNPKAWGGWLKKKAPGLLDNVREELKQDMTQPDEPTVNINITNIILKTDGSSDESSSPLGDCFHVVARLVEDNPSARGGGCDYILTDASVVGDVNPITDTQSYKVI